jgi:hypothetical protein
MNYTVTIRPEGIIEHKFEMPLTLAPDFPLTAMDLATINECSKSKLTSDKLYALAVIARAEERKHAIEEIEARR